MSEDRISKLPDSLLCQILLCLPTKDAVRTSVLSARWRTLWLSVPLLDLDTDDFPDDEAFVSFVHRFLHFDAESCLHRFQLKYDVGEHDASRFKSWIDNVVKRKVQHLEVQNFVVDEDGVLMPPSLNTCETLVCLKLDRVVLSSSELVSLPCLKIMHLEDVSYASDLALETLISCCPVLEDLSMTRNPCDNVQVLRVRSQTLKSFTLEFERSKDGKDYGIIVNAPRLEYLSLIDHQSESFVITGLGSSVELNVNVLFNVNYGDELDPDDLSKRTAIRNFLADISGVNRLTISWDTLEILYHYSRLEPLPQFYNLTHLNATFFNLPWEMLPTLLEASPNLKSFVVGSALFPETEQIRLLSTPRCFLLSLEFVDIERSITGETKEMKLVSYFLENSAVLKRLTLCLSKYPRIKEESTLLEELRTLPRLSSACEIVVR